VDLRLNDRPVDLLDDRGLVWNRRGLQLEGLEISVGGERLFVRAGIGADGDLGGNVSGSLDAVLLRFLIPEWEPAGRAVGVVELLGTPARPAFEGVARVEGGSFRLPRSRTVVSDVNGTVFLSSGDLALEDTTFRFMRGTGRCRGAVVLREEGPRLRLDGSVRGLEYPLYPGLTPRVSGDWRLDGPVSALELSGELVVERAELRGRADLPTVLVDWFGSEKPPRAATLELDLQVRADETLVARNPFLRVVGSADLHVTGTDARPGLTGRIEFQEGGEFTLQGVRYELERGQITFSDPTGVDPMFDIQTRSRILDYEVFLNLNGTLDRLVPSVSSDPPLSPTEIYSLMALGAPGEGRAGGALGLSLASSMLTRQLNETLVARDSWLLPVDQIRVDPYIEAHTGDPSARVTVVKQLSPSVTVTLQSNLTGETDEVISMRWYTGAGFFWEASRDADGNVGVDFKLRRRY
jgi:autotransporter translocation and assembly factor TamB